MSLMAGSVARSFEVQEATPPRRASRFECGVLVVISALSQGWVQAEESEGLVLELAREITYLPQFVNLESGSSELRVVVPDGEWQPTRMVVVRFDENGSHFDLAPDANGVWTGKLELPAGDHRLGVYSGADLLEPRAFFGIPRDWILPYPELTLLRTPLDADPSQSYRITIPPSELAQLSAQIRADDLLVVERTKNETEDLQLACQIAGAPAAGAWATIEVRIDGLAPRSGVEPFTLTIQVFACEIPRPWQQEVFGAIGSTRRWILNSREGASESAQVPLAEIESEMKRALDAVRSGESDQAIDALVRASKVAQDSEVLAADDKTSECHARISQASLGLMDWLMVACEGAEAEGAPIAAARIELLRAHRAASASEFNASLQAARAGIERLHGWIHPRFQEAMRRLDEQSREGEIQSFRATALVDHDLLTVFPPYLHLLGARRSEVLDVLVERFKSAPRRPRPRARPPVEIPNAMDDPLSVLEGAQGDSMTAYLIGQACSQLMRTDLDAPALARVLRLVLDPSAHKDSQACAIRLAARSYEPTAFEALALAAKPGSSLASDELRADAVRGLGGFGGDAAYEVLMSLSADPSGLVRCAVISSVQPTMKSRPEYREFILKAISGDADPQVRAMAVLMLRPRYEQEMALLDAALDSDNEDVVSNALSALGGTIMRDDAMRERALTLAGQSSFPSIRLKVLRMLTMGGQASPQVMQLLEELAASSEDKSVQIQASSLLMQLR